MVLRFSRKNSNYFIGCTAFPSCRNTHNIIVADLVNHLVLIRDYLEELITEITSNEAIQRGDSNAIDNLITVANEAKEHIETEHQEIKEWCRPIFNLDFT